MNLSLWTWMCRGKDMQFVPRIMHTVRALFCLWRFGIIQINHRHILQGFVGSRAAIMRCDCSVYWWSNSEKNVGKYIPLILLYLLSYWHENTKHNKTVLIFYEINLMIEVLGQDFVMDHNMTLWFLAGNGISFSMAACLITLYRS